jgi:hypothetical protein
MTVTETLLQAYSAFMTASGDRSYSHRVLAGRREIQSKKDKKMNLFKKFLFEDKSRARVKIYRIGLPVLIITGLMVVVTTHAQDRREPFKFNLVTPSATIAACVPNAKATVTVLPGEETRGVDTFDLKVDGLVPNTAFTVFLTELPDLPFGASEYIGEFTTNAAGKGSLRVDSIINEAFASTIVSGVRTRAELNHVVIWFADPAADDVCFGPGGGPVTPFDGDNEAGATILSSKNFLPGAPLP